MEHEGKMKKPKKRKTVTGTFFYTAGKPRNPADLTGRNNRARKKDIAALEKRVRQIETSYDKAVTFFLRAKENRIKKLEEKVVKLEQVWEAIMLDHSAMWERIRK